MKSQQNIQDDLPEGFRLPRRMPPPLTQLLDYWNELARRSGSMPSKSLFDPLDIPRLWPGLLLLERAGSKAGGSDWRVRYSGARHDSRFGHSLVNKRAADVLSDTGWRFFDPIGRQVLEHGLPHYRSGRHCEPGQEDAAFERLFVPLADKSGNGAFLVGVWHWQQLPAGGMRTSPDGRHHISTRNRNA